MPFDSNVIPSTGRSASAMAAHMELWKRSEDIWQVYNPTETDFIVYFDRRRSNQKWVVPNKNKDIGHGKGRQNMPQYAMVLYRDKMGIDLINKKSKEEWDVRKLEFRLEDRAKMEESYALRTNNPDEWDKIIPVIIKGVVQRFGGDDVEELLEEAPSSDMTASIGDQAMARLGMSDIDIEQNKQNLLEEIK